jgi:hypothetical protein
MRHSLRLRIPFLLMLAFLVSGSVLLAQSDLEATIAQMNSDWAAGYLQPFADVVGANVNSGFYHSAAIPQAGLNIEFSIIAMGASVGDDQKSFQANAPSGFDPGSFQTATIFGGEGALVTDAATGLQYAGSDGIINTSLFPEFVPQLKVGSFLGTEGIVRFITLPELSDGVIPEVTQFGIGGRHSISQYFPTAPLDVAVGVFYNSFTAGDIIDYNGIAFGAQASKAWELFTLYGGLQWENSTMNLKYASSDPTVTTPAIDIDLEGANTFRFTAGGALTLGLFKFFVDANFGSITAFSGGIGIGS